MWLIAGNEAVGTAAVVFMLGIVLMFCSSMGLLGLVRKSWLILGVLVIVLLAVLFSLFGVMTISFVLGYRMPSLRDIVTDSWQTGCADPGVDLEGCMQAELVANRWCFDHGGLAVPAPGGDGTMFAEGQTDPACAVDATNTETSDAAQRTHACSVACQLAMVATLEDKMGWVAVGCYIAFFTLVFVIMWNSQTHHGLWCIKASPHDDDDENTVMNIAPVMAYVAWILNGLLGIAGISLAVSAGVMLSSPTSYTASFAMLLGMFYFVVAGVACAAVAKNQHWLLRVCNICYFASCVPLLILSLVAAVYSGEIQNVYDSYDDNWCKVRFEIDTIRPEYCMVGSSKMSDAACKAKIVEDTSAHLRIVGYACLFSLTAVSFLIWFSMRLSRKFRFDNRELSGGSASDDVEYYEDDNKGGDDDEEQEGGKGFKDPVQMVLLGAPVFFSLVALGLVFGLGADGVKNSEECSRIGVTAKFNGTGVWGEIRFTQKAREDGVALEIEYQGDTSVYTPQVVQDAITHYEIHEFPVPEDGDCSNLGEIYPSDAAGKYAEQIGQMPATSPTPLVEMLVESSELEQLYYDGEVPPPVQFGNEPAVQLFGERAITGRSVLLKGPGMCVIKPGGAASAVCTAVDPTSRTACEDADCFYIPAEVACGNIVAPGMSVTTANMTAASGFLDGKIRGVFRFSQVTTRGSVSDTIIYIELEATSDWDEAPFDPACYTGSGCPDGTPSENGCDVTESVRYVSCGHNAHVHEGPLDPGSVTSARSGLNTVEPRQQKQVCASAGNHFNLNSGNAVADCEATDVACQDLATATATATQAAACAACTTDGNFAPSDHLPSLNAYECRQSKCETGDLTGMYGKLNIGKPGLPSKYLFVNKYDPTHSLKLGSSGQTGTDMMTRRSVVIHSSQEQASDPKAWPDNAGNRMACADIPVGVPYKSNVDYP